MLLLAATAFCCLAKVAHSTAFDRPGSGSQPPPTHPAGCSRAGRHPTYRLSWCAAAAALLPVATTARAATAASPPGASSRGPVRAVGLEVAGRPSACCARASYAWTCVASYRQDTRQATTCTRCHATRRNPRSCGRSTARGAPSNRRRRHRCRRHRRRRRNRNRNRSSHSRRRRQELSSGAVAWWRAAEAARRAYVCSRTGCGTTCLW